MRCSASKMGMSAFAIIVGQLFAAETNSLARYIDDQGGPSKPSNSKRLHRFETLPEHVEWNRRVQQERQINLSMRGRKYESKTA